MARKINWLPRVGTVLCWLGSLLSLTPYIGLFFLPIALLGGLLVGCSRLSVRAKLLRGLVPLVVPVVLYGRWLLA